MAIELHSKKPLGIFSLVMINVIAIDSLRSLPVGAEYGFSLLFYYLIATFFFFIPTALCSAELATGWPETGGVYVWTREAFGGAWGFFTIWLQWIYTVVWYPTILAFMATTLAYLFNPALKDNPIYLLTIMLILFWLTTWLNCYGMKVSGWISTAGALLGTLFPIALIIILGTAWTFSGKTQNINISWQGFWPDLKGFSNLAFIVGILFGLMGMEMSAVHAEEVKNPQRDYPRSVLYSVIVIITTLVLGSLAIAMVVPHAQLNLVSGVLDAFVIFFSAYHLGMLVPIIVLCIFLGGLSSVSTWVIGPTKGLLEASRDGALPSTLAKVNSYKAPVNILIIQGIIFTLLCSVFVLMPTINSSYWILSALTSQLGLMMYIMMFAALIKLRYSKPEVKRSYKIPGGNLGVWIVGGAGILICCLAIGVGFLPPQDLKIQRVWGYELFLWIGLITMSGIPFIIYFCEQNAKRKNNAKKIR